MTGMLVMARGSVMRLVVQLEGGPLDTGERWRGASQVALLGPEAESNGSEVIEKRHDRSGIRLPQVEGREVGVAGLAAVDPAHGQASARNEPSWL